MKYVIAIFALLVLSVLSIAGFRGGRSEKPPIMVFPDMDFQAKYEAQGASPFFQDGRSDRPVIPGTVPFITEEQEHFQHLAPKDRFFEDTYLATGKIGNDYGQGFPIELNQQDLLRGQTLFNINCAVCHGAVGDGNGVTKQYGMIAVADLLQERIVDMPEGKIFETITYGFNTMGPYGHKIREEDRWRVIAYLRALQFAAKAPADAVPAERRKSLGL